MRIQGRSQAKGSGVTISEVAQRKESGLFREGSARQRWLAAGELDTCGVIEAGIIETLV